jgi:ribosomal protein S18 acetylase RimI-like enzyme
VTPKSVDRLDAVIRRARADDAYGLLDCLLRAFEEYRGDYTEEAFASTVLTPETMRRRLREMAVYVAQNHDGTVSGTISWSKAGPKEGHLRGMAVRPEFQGSGLGGRLLRRVERDMRAAGCSIASLNTTAVLRRAIGFYEKRGYRGTGRAREWFGMSIHEFSKDLGAAGGEPDSKIF